MGEYLTRLRWEYGQIQPGMAPTTRPLITGRIVNPDNAGAPVAIGASIRARSGSASAPANWPRSPPSRCVNPAASVGNRCGWASSIRAAEASVRALWVLPVPGGPVKIRWRLRDAGHFPPKSGGGTGAVGAGWVAGASAEAETVGAGAALVAVGAGAALVAAGAGAALVAVGAG